MAVIIYVDIITCHTTPSGVHAPRSPVVRTPHVTYTPLASWCPQASGFLVCASLLVPIPPASCCLQAFIFQVSIRLPVLTGFLVFTSFRSPSAYTSPPSYASWFLHASVTQVSTRLLVSVRPGLLLFTRLMASTRLLMPIHLLTIVTLLL